MAFTATGPPKKSRSLRPSRASISGSRSERRCSVGRLMMTPIAPCGPYWVNRMTLWLNRGSMMRWVATRNTPAPSFCPWSAARAAGPRRAVSAGMNPSSAAKTVAPRISPVARERVIIHESTPNLPSRRSGVGADAEWILVPASRTPLARVPSVSRRRLDLSGRRITQVGSPVPAAYHARGIVRSSSLRTVAFAVHNPVPRETRSGGTDMRSIVYLLTLSTALVGLIAAPAAARGQELPAKGRPAGQEVLPSRELRRQNASRRGSASRATTRQR